jgi:hypothetical protein
VERQEGATASALRRGLLWVAALTSVGIAVELAADRHWTQPIQLVAWGALAVLALGIVLVATARSAARVRVGRVLVVAVMLSAGLGIWEHVEANHEAGELDFEYGNTWETLAAPTRWWLAATKTVGPSPPLAPGALAQASLCVLLATLRHPALKPDGPEASALARAPDAGE